MVTSQKPIQVALLGCGTVGGGVIRLLAANRAKLATRVGAPIVVRKVLVRDIIKDRVPECDRSWLTTNPDDVLGDPDTDIVVEVMGGEIPAYDYIPRALAAQNSVLPPNTLL